MVAISSDFQSLRGVRIGIDVGTARIGVARTDPDGIMALPYATVPAGDEALKDILTIVDDFNATVVYVGNPISLSGESTRSTDNAVTFSEELATATTVPVYLVDERLSTVSAAAQLRSAGRNAKNSKEIIDQAAAVVILESALVTEKRTGERCGSRVASQR